MLAGVGLLWLAVACWWLAGGQVASGPETWQGEVGAGEWACWGPETWQGKALKRGGGGWSVGGGLGS